MTSNTGARPSYIVQLVEDSILSPDQRAAAELRFRMALEFALGGPEYVLPSLQAYMLAQALSEPSGEDEVVSEDDEDSGGAQQMITLWEKAESDALRAALKPLDKRLAEARFEIIPSPD